MNIIKKIFIMVIIIPLTATLFYSNSSLAHEIESNRYFQAFKHSSNHFNVFNSSDAEDFYNPGYKNEILPTHVDDIFWDSKFTLPGIDGRAFAIVADGHNIYVGGHFAVAGTLLVNNIAVWNSISESWEALDGGVTGGYDNDATVYSIAISGDKVYVGGNFDYVGEIQANNIAAWNGQEWETLGNGITEASSGYPVVRALAVDNNNLYAGGYFDRAGSTSVNHLARWDDSDWYDVGGGVSGSSFPAVLAVEVIGNDLYVGGGFNRAGSLYANYIARWDGSSWHRLGNGIYHPTFPFVFAMGKHGDDLYVGGSFNSAGGVYARCIARWSDSSWYSMENGVSGGVGSTSVYNLSISPDGVVYICGNFTVAGDTSANFVSRWDGDEWLPLMDGTGNGLEYIATAIDIDDNGELFIGGLFNAAGNRSAYHLAKYDGNHWMTVGSEPRSPNDFVYDIEATDNNIYVGGEFSHAGTLTVNHIACQSIEGQWSRLGGGLDGPVYAIEASADTVFAAGYFSNAGGVPVDNIAFWDGLSWNSMGDGLDGPVNDIIINGDFVFAGGNFTHSGSLNLRYVAAWNRTLNIWETVGAGSYNGVNNAVLDLEFFDGNLYLGGFFTRAGDIGANHFAIWDGANWSTLDGGLDMSVYSIAIYSNEIYALVPMIGVGRWSGYNWMFIGLPYAHVLESDENYLYAGGQFYEFTGAPGNNIARWNGQVWSEMGSGINGTIAPSVLTLDTEGQNVYAGGTFTIAGDKPSYFMARWNENLLDVDDIAEFPESFGFLQNYPNPFNMVTIIEYELKEQEMVTMEIYDLLGRKVESLVNKVQLPGYYRISWNAIDKSSGIYFVNLRAGRYSQTAKMSLLK